MIDLKSKPFNLTDDDIQWVKETLAGIDLRAKVGQLFCILGRTPDEDKLKEILQVIKPGAMMFRPAPGGSIQKAHRFLQENSDIPLLLAANLERGGIGIATDGTDFGSPLQVAATDDETMAYRLGLVCGREGRTVGCNWAFAPVVDIDMNYQNPITNTRTFGSNPERVLRMARAYMKGIHKCGLGVSIKHWPGDGVDSRDQHLVTSINSLSVEEWDETYRRVYKGMIDAGADTVMAAHIMLPAYSRMLNPGIRDEKLMPASLAPELNYKLLREQLGFNGLIVTDATHMAGFTVAMKREMAVPATIAAGCDMFLFPLDLEEDLEFMLQGLEHGILTAERLDEAVTRILALKASLQLHRQKEEETLVPDETALEVLDCPEHKAWAIECADKAITLVKDTQNLLPLSAEKNKRILLYVLGDVGGYLDNSQGANVKFIQLLEEQGFVVTKYDYSKTDDTANHKPVRSLKEAYDLVLYFASLKTASNQTVVRINWAQPMGADVPKFINDIPAAFVSIDNPYHLQDVPRVKTFINGYTPSGYVVEALVAKLLGKSPFKGINPIDPFCGYWEAKL